MKDPRDPIIKAARDLAQLCAEIRAAHPEHDWRVQSAPPVEETPIDPRVEGALRLYRDGAPAKVIAQHIGITTATLYPMITRWRRAGWWPEDATRKTGRPRKS